MIVDFLRLEGFIENDLKITKTESEQNFSESTLK